MRATDWAFRIGAGAVCAGLWACAANTSPKQAAFVNEAPSSDISTPSAAPLPAEAIPVSLPAAHEAPERRGEMVSIAAGNYWTGCDLGTDPACRAEDGAFAERYVDAYQIDVYEVTVADYRACVDAGACDATDMGGLAAGEDWMFCNWGKPGKDDHPINCVSWEQASTYCAWNDKRLPTEAEWEKAARGSDKRSYPWGDEMITCEYAVTNETNDQADKGCGLNSTQPVGSRPKGVSPYGVHDIVGNVWEWTADAYDGPVDPARGGNEKVGKGGCWGSGSPYNSRISWSHHYPANYRSNVRLGFRCAADPADSADTPSLASR